MSRTRFMTGSLATLAVASAFTLAGPSADAADLGDRPCGQPGVDAVYETVNHDAVLRTVPAVTHDEWRWERDIEVHEFEFARTSSPARVEADWAREVPAPVEYLYSRVVVDSPAVPAVPGVPRVPAVPGTPEVAHDELVTITPAVVVTLWKYVHENTGKVTWERDDWGAQNGEGKGWKKTDETKVEVITPAVTAVQRVVDVPAVPGTPAIPAIPGTDAIPAVTHTETRWAFGSPGADWTGPVDSRSDAPLVETVTTAGDTPAGTGWRLLATREYAAVVDTAWAASAPDGFAPTGASRVASVDHQETDAPAASAPAGEGWTTVEGSAVTVEDVAETTEVVAPAYTEKVLLSAAVPATDPCPVVVSPSDDPAENEDPTEGIISDGGPQLEQGDAVSGPQAAPAPGESTAPAAVLPNTGGFPAWMAPAGLAALIAGSVLVRGSRRRTP